MLDSNGNVNSVTQEPAIELNRVHESIEDFRARLRGPLLLSGSPGYDDTRSVWNAMIDRKPELIARCLGVADVVACVNFARERGLSLSIKGGGHNISGLAVCDGGLMLDMSLMRGVWVDAASRTARARLAACLATWTAKHKFMVSPRCSALFPTPALRVSRWVAGSVT